MRIDEGSMNPGVEVDAPDWYQLDFLGRVVESSNRGRNFVELDTAREGGTGNMRGKSREKSRRALLVLRLSSAT